MIFNSFTVANDYNFGAQMQGSKQGSYRRCPLLLLRTFSAHPKVVARATRRTRGLFLSPVSLGGSSYFLWKRCVVFQQMTNNFDLLLSVL